MQIIGHIMAWKSYSFVCPFHYFITMIMPAYLGASEIENVYQIHHVEWVSQINQIHYIIFYAVYGAVCSV